MADCIMTSSSLIRTAEAHALDKSLEPQWQLACRQPIDANSLHHSILQITEINGASGYGSDDVEAKIRNRKPPSLVQRVLAAFFYIVPWLDIVSVGYEYHRRFPTSIIFCVIPGKSIFFKPHLSYSHIHPTLSLPTNCILA